MSTHEVAKGTSVVVDEDHIVEARPWSIIGDLRAPGSGYDDDANYDCADALKPKFSPAIDFDCETSCFYAYARNQEDALELVNAIEEWLVSHRAAHPEWAQNANRGYN